MKHISSFFVVIIATSCLLMLQAQPSYIYEGGDGGGYSSDEDSITTLYQFQGGSGVGYSLIDELNTIQYLFRGGFGEGYSFTDELNTIQYLFHGGLSDGYSSSQILLDNSPLYLGGVSGGFIKVGTNDSQTIQIFEGGLNDGYVLTEKCEDFIWTGTIGTGWLVSENWNYNIVPDLKRRVIIPSSVPNFPHLNAGTFAIRDNPNGGIYECADLWIQESALLVSRVSNYIENYGTILIDGTMEVKNPSVGSIQNLDAGLIRISSTGFLLIKP